MKPGLAGLHSDVVPRGYINHLWRMQATYVHTSSITKEQDNVGRAAFGANGKL